MMDNKPLTEWTDQELRIAIGAAYASDRASGRLIGGRRWEDWEMNARAFRAQAQHAAWEEAERRGLDLSWAIKL